MAKLWRSTLSTTFRVSIHIKWSYLAEFLSRSIPFLWEVNSNQVYVAHAKICSHLMVVVLQASFILWLTRYICGTFLQPCNISFFLHAELDLIPKKDQTSGKISSCFSGLQTETSKHPEKGKYFLHWTHKPCCTGVMSSDGSIVCSELLFYSIITILFRCSSASNARWQHADMLNIND